MTLQRVLLEIFRLQSLHVQEGFKSLIETMKGITLSNLIFLGFLVVSM